MIVVIVDHYVKPGLMEAAERRVNANGALAADAPGLETPVPLWPGWWATGPTRDQARAGGLSHYVGRADDC